MNDMTTLLSIPIMILVDTNGIRQSLALGRSIKLLTLQSLYLVGEGLDALLAVVHLDVEAVVLEPLGHGDLLVHVQLPQELLLRGNQFLRRKRMMQFSYQVTRSCMNFVFFLLF